MKPPPGFGREVNKYLNHYVNVADAKAAGILTVNLALTGYLLANTPAGPWPRGFHWAALLMLLASALMALFVIYPRTPKIGSSIIFWEDIRSRGLEIYLHDLSATDEAEIERQYGAQNYLVSGILQEKYRAVQWAMRALIGGFVAIASKIILGG